jgi:hypothetical protein
MYNNQFFMHQKKTSSQIIKILQCNDICTQNDYGK